MAPRVKFKGARQLNVGRIVSKIAYTILGLFVGGFFLMELGKSMLGSCSPFYSGLSLIGWQVGNNATANSLYNGTHYLASPVTQLTSVGASVYTGCEYSSYILYDTNASGILTIVGLIALASIIMEFVQIKW